MLLCFNKPHVLQQLVSSTIMGHGHTALVNMTTNFCLSIMNQHGTQCPPRLTYFWKSHSHIQSPRHQKYTHLQWLTPLPPICWLQLQSWTDTQMFLNFISLHHLLSIPFQVPSFSSFTSIVPHVLVPLSFYFPCCLKEVWDTLSVHFYLFMFPSLPSFIPSHEAINLCSRLFFLHPL